MLETATIEATGARKLVLGFDGGCATCSDLAERISERVGDRLEVRSLLDPQVEHWREQTLGKNAPWAPTLFEITGNRAVRAWTGWQMGLSLTRSLGPSDTWKIMQVLGDESRQADTSEPTNVRSILSRSQFLKGVSGLTVAISILTGTKILSTPAVAAQENGEIAIDQEGLNPISGPQATKLRARVLRHPDTKALQRRVSHLRLRVPESRVVAVEDIDKHNARYFVGIPVYDPQNESVQGVLLGSIREDDSVDVEVDVSEIKGNEATTTVWMIEDGQVKHHSVTREIELRPEQEALEGQPDASEGEITTQGLCCYSRCSKYAGGYVKQNCFFICSLGCTPAKLNGVTRVACLSACRYVVCYVPRYCARYRRVCYGC